MKASHEIAYRHELDGLRAIAVVAVILFHAGFKSMPGGFIGVDVFFVLSGYLICGQTWLRLKEGRYSVSEFFARRIRRLSTAYFACFLVTALAAAGLFLREGLTEVTANLLGSVTFTNNYNLLFSQGYFNTDAHGNPFLHTWSLSIEEQFYIGLPILILVTRRSLKTFERMLVVFFVASLGVMLFSGEGIYLRDQRFFATSFRIWELALGGLVFLAQRKEWRLPPVPFLPLVGLAAVVLPVGWIDATYLYPGWITLLPTLGTALLIGVAQPGRSRTGRVLASRPMAYVGRISYGAYLWHWPLIVFTIYLWGALHDELRAALTLVSLGLGALSYHLIELPIRRVDVKRHKRRLYGLFVVQTAILLGAVVLLNHMSTQPNTLADRKLQIIKDEIGNFHPGWNDCWSRPTPEEFCRIGAQGEGPVEYLAWGDSMTNSAYWAFDAYGKATGRRGVLATAAACAPLPEISREYGGAETCIGFNRGVLEYLRKAPRMEVILFARWTYYGEGYLNQRSNTPDQAAMVDARGSRLPGTNFEIFAPAFEALLDEIGQRHKVTIVNLWPVVPYSVPVNMLREAWFGNLAAPVTMEDYEARNGRVVDFITEAGRSRAMRVINPHETLCASGVCMLSKDGVPLYVDQTHLSHAGNDILRDLLLERGAQDAQ